MTTDEINDFYGIDEEGPIAAVDDSEGVEVPQVQVALSQEQTNQLSSVDPLCISNSMGFDVYIHVLQIFNAS